MPYPRSPRRDGDQDGPPPDEVPVIIIHGQDREGARTRSSLKRERVNNETALSELAIDLLPFNVDKWTKLGVPADTIDALVVAQKIKTYAARERHLRLIRARLRDADWPIIRRRLDHLRAGYALGQGVEPTTRVVQITEDLLVQGEAGLVRFLEEFPDADRRRLRQLIRNVAGAPPAKRGKVRLQLERAVESELRGATSVAPLALHVPHENDTDDTDDTDDA